MNQAILHPGNGNASSGLQQKNPDYDLHPYVLMELFDQPINFNRIYVHITGNALAALMLSYAVQARQNLEYEIRERKLTERNVVILPEEESGWVAISDKEWEVQCGLTPAEIKKTRKFLIEHNFLLYRKTSSFVWYAINQETIQASIAKLSITTSAAGHGSSTNVIDQTSGE